jgi:hypothetical protein
VVNDEDAIDKCVEELTSAIKVATVASAPKRRPSADKRPPLTASIQDYILLKNQLKRQWQLTRHPALKTQTKRLQRSVTYRLNDWRNEEWTDTLQALNSEDKSPWKMTKRVLRVPTPSPPFQVPGGPALSDSEKAEAGCRPDSRGAQLQPVYDPPDPAGTEMVNEGMSAHEYAPASEPKLTSPSEVLQAIMGLKFSKAPGSNIIPRIGS